MSVPLLAGTVTIRLALMQHPICIVPPGNSRRFMQPHDSLDTRAFRLNLEASLAKVQYMPCHTVTPIFPPVVSNTCVPTPVLLVTSLDRHPRRFGQTRWRMKSSPGNVL